MVGFWWRLSEYLDDSVNSPQRVLHSVEKNTFRVTLFLDLSVLTQKIINTYAPNIFPSSSLECQQFATKMSLDWALCVCVCRSRSGGRDIFRKDHLTACCLYLEHRITNDIEGLMFLQDGRTWVLIKLVLFFKTL